MNTKWLAIAVVAMVSGLSGCASARVVRSDPASVVVSVPDEGYFSRCVTLPGVA